MRRGEIRIVDLEPIRGAEASETRPAVIVTDGANSTATRLGRGVVTVVPVTSNVERIYPFQVLLKAAARDCSETPRRRRSKSTRLPLNASGSEWQWCRPP